jgi:hypothetical protein
MKALKFSLRFIIPVIIILVLFNITSVSVTDSTNGSAVSFARVDFLNANGNGKASFLDIIFKTKLHITRIGYKEENVSIPFGLFVKNKKISLSEASFDGINEQLLQYSNQLDNYAYSLSTAEKQNGNSETTSITAKKNGNDFYFKMVTQNNTESKSTVVIVKGNKMYKSVNGEALVGPLSDTDRQDFSNNNLIFIGVQDALLTVFPSSQPTEILFDHDTIDMKWNNVNVKLTISEKGAPKEISYNEKSPTIERSGTLSIETGGITIAVDENG